MPKYNVTAIQTIEYSYEIEAVDEQEAIDFAQEVPTEKWTHQNTDFDVESAELI
jgi:hypothetical protein